MVIIRQSVSADNWSVVQLFIKPASHLHIVSQLTSIQMKKKKTLSDSRLLVHETYISRLIWPIAPEVIILGRGRQFKEPRAHNSKIKVLCSKVTTAAHIKKHISDSRLLVYETAITAYSDNIRSYQREDANAMYLVYTIVKATLYVKK